VTVLEEANRKQSMSREKDDLVNSLDEALKRVAGEEPDIIETVRAIVYTNLADSRVQTFLDNGSASSPADYVARVVATYKRWHNYVQQIQVAQDFEAWKALLSKLEAWANGFLKRNRFPFGQDRLEAARDCAADAGGVIVGKPFPYDVHFDRWACIIVHFSCLQHIDRLWGNKNRKLESDANLEEILDFLEDPKAANALHRTELRMDLRELIEQLTSEDRKQFVRLQYFEHKTIDEIAEIMDRSKNALYGLHYKTLQQLRQIWEAGVDIDALQRLKPLDSWDTSV
jgi:RNA polymerase sigma factor (sigma-70 family)